MHEHRSFSVNERIFAIIFRLRNGGRIVLEIGASRGRRRRPRVLLYNLTADVYRITRKIVAIAARDTELPIKKSATKKKTTRNPS